MDSIRKKSSFRSFIWIGLCQFNEADNKKKYLTELGFEVDYLTICDASTLEDCFSIDTNDLLVAVAAKLGEVRLIDNILLTKL